MRGKEAELASPWIRARRGGRVCPRKDSGEGDSKTQRGAHGAEEAREHGEEEDGDEQIQNATVRPWSRGGERR